MIDYAVIIQARMGSTRYSGKIAYEISGKPMLWHQLQRLKQGGIENIFVATTLNDNDDITVAISHECGIECFRGDENDVMKRYIDAAEFFRVRNVIRVGGDDPLIDPKCITELIEVHRRNPVDLVYASHKFGWIYGTAGELVKLEALKRAHALTQSASDREHVISFVKNSDRFSKIKAQPSDPREVRPDIFLSVDYKEDIELVESIIKEFVTKQNKVFFTQRDVIDLYDSGKVNIKNKHLHTGFEIN